MKLPQALFVVAALLTCSTLPHASQAADSTAASPLVAQGVGTVKGKVTGKDGKPAEGVPVKFFGAISHPGSDRDEAMLLSQMAATTDKEGNFEIKLPANTYKFEANKFGHPDGYASGRLRVTAGEIQEKKIQLQ